MSRLTRVLHVVRPEEAGSIGGADLHVLELATAQARQGLCEPVVLAPGASPGFLHRASGLEVEVLDPLTPPRGRWRRLAAVPRQLGTDLLHAHGYEADYLAAWLPTITPSWCGLPAVMTCHGIITPDLRHRVMSTLDLHCMRRASALIAVTDTAAKLLQARVPGSDVHMIPNGVRIPDCVVPSSVLERAEFGASNDDVLVGYVGRLSAEKRPDLFVRAAELIAARCARARFVIVGGGPLQHAVHEHAARSAVADRIVHAGLRHDMDRVYAALDLLVVPSDTEGTPRVVIEAQVRGIPVAATAVGGVPTLVTEGETGLLVPRGDAAGLASSALRLVDDGALRASYGAAARASAARWSVDAMATSVQDVYGLVTWPHS